MCSELEDVAHASEAEFMSTGYTLTDQGTNLEDSLNKTSGKYVKQTSCLIAVNRFDRDV